MIYHFCELLVSYCCYVHHKGVCSRASYATMRAVDPESLLSWLTQKNFKQEAVTYSFGVQH